MRRCVRPVPRGLLVAGASARLICGPRAYHLAVHEAGKIRINDQPVVIGTHPAIPQKVFICPACQNIRYKLFEVGGRWSCYRCHGLTHASRHVHRSIPGLNRLLYLRRQIGAALAPFTEIAPRPAEGFSRRMRRRKYWRIVAEIRQIERELVGHARRDVADVLEKRHERETRSRRYRS
jgi:hypothetical protein